MKSGVYLITHFELITFPLSTFQIPHSKKHLRETPGGVFYKIIRTQNPIQSGAHCAPLQRNFENNIAAGDTIISHSTLHIPNSKQFRIPNSEFRIKSELAFVSCEKVHTGFKELKLMPFFSRKGLCKGIENAVPRPQAVVHLQVFPYHFRA